MPEPPTDQSHQTPLLPGSSAPLSLDQLAHIAEQVAGGQMPLPEYLTPSQLLELAGQVRRHRRQRLLRFLARAIADDLYRADQQS